VIGNTVMCGFEKLTCDESSAILLSGIFVTQVMTQLDVEGTG